ncbi:hypothetical protein EPUS_08648 [Endocarpon pusillum Z07020]|uniref:C2H2-type domain-containing protein n=1 Tax=Endocarpon pusillum (strain Z07020 / HMAS-L-300199) TaxID=1263415 RepID=U1GCE9_ENDPU|nr:uncharacterized protein EPUS_08648 [Endocarpon pusillum Z07020]ERF69376.1 hypothetical protein EPUS_08648 [Endocarpon pusillum Z07020]
MSAQSVVGDSRTGSAPRIGSAYMCNCCPKKPKKFGTEDDLRKHMLEKPNECDFCPNRFKNKNEAERHQNSIHLRPYSWSCGAILSYEIAFHPLNSLTPLSYDICGYCGEEFTNSPRDWDARFVHLTNVHKFGECDKTKKFFRADHFRQHLKHSHAGTRGNWWGVLENAGRKDEPPQKVRNRDYENA